MITETCIQNIERNAVFQLVIKMFQTFYIFIDINKDVMKLFE